MKKLGSSQKGKIIPFPKKMILPDPATQAREAIEKRFGITFKEFMGENGKRTPEVEEKMKRAMRKETLRIASELET